jgi:hypothetical protein
MTGLDNRGLEASRFTDKAAILVREHRIRHKISRTPEARYKDDCIEVH